MPPNIESAFKGSNAEVHLGNAGLELVRAKIVRGLSVEFVALQERSEANLRIIERARLVGIGVVDTPAYPASAIEARAAALSRRVHRRVWL